MCICWNRCQKSQKECYHKGWSHTLHCLVSEKESEEAKVMLARLRLGSTHLYTRSAVSGLQPCAFLFWNLLSATQNGHGLRLWLLHKKKSTQVLQEHICFSYSTARLIRNYLWSGTFLATWTRTPHCVHSAIRFFTTYMQRGPALMFENHVYTAEPVV